MAKRMLIVVAGVCAGWLPHSGAVLASPEADQKITSPAGSTSRSGLVKIPDPGSPEERLYRAMAKQRVETEREMKLIRARYFRGIRNTEIRQVGIAKLRGFTDPAVFPSLLEIYEREERDVRGAVVRHLADQKTDEGDATLAWAAVFDKDEWFRQTATEALKERIAETGSVSSRVKVCIAQGLRDERVETVSAAAQLGRTLSLYEMIPALINAQIRGGGGGGGGASRGDGDGALAYILVGTQQAFVADLQPVVGDSAVGFDPELGVVTSGTVLRVIDAVVITYLVDVHNALVGLSTEGWGGRSTAHLGWDNAAWRSWYVNEFVPHRREVESEAAAATP